MSDLYRSHSPGLTRPAIATSMAVSRQDFAIDSIRECSASSSKPGSIFGGQYWRYSATLSMFRFWRFDTSSTGRYSVCFRFDTASTANVRVYWDWPVYCQYTGVPSMLLGCMHCYCDACSRIPGLAVPLLCLFVLFLLSHLKHFPN